MNAVGEHGEKTVQDAMPHFRIDARGEVHRFLDIDEEHRHLFALALDGPADGEDFLDEMVRRIRAWLRHSNETAGIIGPLKRPVNRSRSRFKSRDVSATSFGDDG